MENKERCMYPVILSSETPERNFEEMGHDCTDEKSALKELLICFLAVINRANRLPAVDIGAD